MEGKLLGGRYELEKKVGGGGMAIVYKARDLMLHRTVAVKVLRPQFGYDEDFVNRFRREAQAVASMSHPNVVSVYDVGQDGDTHYIVMEYIEGSTLKDIINAKGALPIEEAVRIALQVCDALDHAHQNRIIHRDIKPHNILIGKNGRVKVTDFGIARAVTQATITHTGSVLGSVHYFSPEQARGGITEEKSDIYSLGIVLYEMVTGQVPFSGESPISVALKHLQEPLPEPRQINPKIPQSVENIILKALVKNPVYRYHNAAEMVQDLETCLKPERKNEPKVSIPTDDEETRVMPAITTEMLEHAKQERQERISGGGSRFTEPPSKPERKWWVKASIWVGIASLFLVLAFLGFNFLLKIFYVPEVAVPLVEGTPVAIAEAKLKEANLVPVLVEQYSDKVEQGIVFRQDPAPPMKLKEKANVTLYVSKGQQAVPMPSLIGLDRATAEETLKLKGFTITPDTFTEREDDNAREGDVIEQFPLPNEEVIPSKAEVKVTISKGKRYLSMPDLRNMTVDRAKLELLKAGLAEGPVTKEDTYVTQEPGIVLSTYPYEPKMQVAAGTEIPLQVSSGKFPADAKSYTTPVFVEVMPGESDLIRITVTDARGANRVVVEETISDSKEYSVPLVLAPGKDATITVTKNNQSQPYQSFSIPYSSLQ